MRAKKGKNKTILLVEDHFTVKHGRIQNGQGVGTILNDDTASITIDDGSVVEGDSGNTNSIFTIRTTKPSIYDIQVDFATATGTASTPADFLTTSGTAVISPGSTYTTVSVPVVGNVSFGSTAAPCARVEIPDPRRSHLPLELPCGSILFGKTAQPQDIPVSPATERDRGEQAHAR